MFSKKNTSTLSPPDKEIVSARGNQIHMDVKHHFRQHVSYIVTVHLNKFCIMFHFRGNRHALILVYNNIFLV
jgi:hypothetical protein